MLIEELAAMYSTVPSIFQRIVMITIIYNNNDNGDNGTDGQMRLISADSPHYPSLSNVAPSGR